MKLSSLTNQISRVKNIEVIFRLGIFALLAAVIVLMFPRYNNAFRYHFEINKPWGYNNITADFDFPIYKTDEQMAKRIYQTIAENPVITTLSIAQELNLSERYVEKHIKELKELGLIERIGPKTKGGGWRIAEK